MANLRKGDTVLIRATVTQVASFGVEQQIMVDFGPKAERTFGWCVPGEYDFRLDHYSFAVGDRVLIDTQLAGEIMAVTSVDKYGEAYVWVKPDGRTDFRTLSVKGLRRI